MVEYEKTPEGAFAWAGLGRGDEGQVLSVAKLADPTVQVIGDLGHGGMVVLEGSLEGDPKNWFPLVNRQGETASFARPSGMLVAGALMHVRPRMQGGDDDTRVTVLMLFSERKR